MRHHFTKDIQIVLPEAALKVIFDECDRFDDDETGGRIIGTFKEDDDGLTLHITGLLEAGPNASRTRVSFFQDGEYQERIFRQIEGNHPHTEHLGTWHTHHVNGLQTLSGGDLETYSRTVNHASHNTDFFYALLVTTRHRATKLLDRYSIKHFVFRRGDDRVLEVPSSHVTLTHSPLVWPASGFHPKTHPEPSLPASSAPPGRLYDRDILQEFYPDIRPLASKALGFYWRGMVHLLDESKAEIVVVENEEDASPKYSVVVRNPSPHLKEVAEGLANQDFSSARSAVITAERLLNRAAFQRSHSEVKPHKKDGD